MNKETDIEWLLQRGAHNPTVKLTKYQLNKLRKLRQINVQLSDKAHEANCKFWRYAGEVKLRSW